MRPQSARLLAWYSKGANRVKITCIGHSGFLVELDGYNLIFDYYTDEKGVITPEVFKGKRTCVFVSHNHYDHYSKGIFEWAEFGEVAYVLENDCDADREVFRVGEGDELALFDGHIEVKAYGSTDEGVSFLVKAGDVCIFHAGDLNDWHWTGEMNAGELAEMEAGYLRVLDRLVGTDIDVAFIPRDRRLREHAERGIKSFEKIVGARKIVPMHFPGNAGVVY